MTVLSLANHVRIIIYPLYTIRYTFIPMNITVYHCLSVLKRQYYQQTIHFSRQMNDFRTCDSQKRQLNILLTD